MKQLTAVALISLLMWQDALYAATSDRDVQILQSQAEALIERDLDAAEKAIEQALALAPDSAELHSVCGRIMGRQAGEAFFMALSYARKSLACLQQAVALAPDNPRYYRGLLDFYLGAPSIAGGDVTLAWQQVEKIQALDPRQGALAMLDFYQRTRNEAEYLQALERTTRAFPQSAAVQLQWGLAQQAKHAYALAMQAFIAGSQAEEEEKAFARWHAWYQIGRTAVFSGEFNAQGIEALKYYVAHAPSEASLPDKYWAHFRLAQLYAQQGEREQADEHLEHAKKSDDKALKNELIKLHKQLSNGARPYVAWAM